MPGSRSGWSHTASRPSVPRAAASSSQSAAASRSRRGRSSRPTRVANVCSAGPPVARRRRTVSRSGGRRGERGRGCGDHGVHPALDECEQRLQPGQGRLLGGGVLGGDEALLHGVLNLGEVARVDAAHELLEPPGVDGDAGGIVGDRRVQGPLEPRHVGEQPVVGRLAQGEVEPHLVVRDAEALTELRDVLRARRTAVPAGPSGSPTSVPVTTSPASWPTP